MPKTNPKPKPSSRTVTKAKSPRKTKDRTAAQKAPKAASTIPANGLVTLTTDFGVQDAYVAAMKGVIYTRFPTVRLVDLSHEIQAQFILGAALFLADATPYFPPGTVHLVVVDPGVGTDRKAIAAQVNDQFFVCPDNGLLSMVFESHPLQELREITNPDVMQKEISNTFHGRDIFAPVAAQLAQGMPLEAVGPELDGIVMAHMPQPVSERDMIQGEVIYVDHFGNCVTNIMKDMLREDTEYRVQFAATTITGIARNYAGSPPETAMALFGSSGRLEIAVRDGNAAKEFGIRPGAPVTLFIP